MCNKAKTIKEIKLEMAEGASRLYRAGVISRNVEARLKWKEKNGINTEVERYLLRNKEE